MCIGKLRLLAKNVEAMVHDLEIISESDSFDIITKHDYRVDQFDNICDKVQSLQWEVQSLYTDVRSAKLNPVAKIVWEWEEEMSGPIAVEFIEDISGLTTLEDVKAYYTINREWGNNPDELSTLINMIIDISKRIKK